MPELNTPIPGNPAEFQVKVTLSKKTIQEAAISMVAAAVLILILTKIINKHL